MAISNFPEIGNFRPIIGFYIFFCVFGDFRSGIPLPRHVIDPLISSRNLPLKSQISPGV